MTPFAAFMWLCCLAHVGAMALYAACIGASAIEAVQNWWRG